MGRRSESDWDLAMRAQYVIDTLPDLISHWLLMGVFDGGL